MPCSHRYGRRVDVYAFGVVVYELFAHTIASARLGLDNPYKEQLYMKKVKEHGIGLGVPDSWPESLRSLASRQRNSTVLRMSGQQQLRQTPPTTLMTATKTTMTTAMTRSKVGDDGGDIDADTAVAVIVACAVASRRRRRRSVVVVGDVSTSTFASTSKAFCPR